MDISHVSNKTAHDVLTHSLAPPIFSHSSAFALHAHERNVDDSVLRRLPATDGVVMVMFYKAFLTGDEACSVDDVADHVLHIARVAGWRHVGIGSDFDGIDGWCSDLEDSSKYPDLIASILKKAPLTTDAQIIGLLGGNLLRVWEKADQIKLALKSEKPCEVMWSERKPWKIDYSPYK